MQKKKNGKNAAKGHENIMAHKKWTRKKQNSIKYERQKCIEADTTDVK